MRKIILCFSPILLLILTTNNVVAKEFKLTSGQRQMLASLEGKGLLEFRCGKVYIDRGLWNSMAYQKKDDFCATLAIACAQKLNIDSYQVDVYDLISGKKLAKWSKNWGFEIY